jgi:hypothetical protein
MLRPTDILADVEAVLLAARRGRGSERKPLTAYQILAALRPVLRRRLLSERPFPGRGARAHYSAAHVVSHAARLVPNVRVHYADPAGMEFRIGRRLVEAGYGVCAMYRIP